MFCTCRIEQKEFIAVEYIVQHHQRISVIGKSKSSRAQRAGVEKDKFEVRSVIIGLMIWLIKESCKKLTSVNLHRLLSILFLQMESISYRCIQKNLVMTKSPHKTETKFNVLGRTLQLGLQFSLKVHHCLCGKLLT